MTIERKDAAWKKAATAFEKAKLAAAPVVAELDKARAKIIELAGEESAIGFGVLANRKRRAGSVNYADIPELQDVDLGQYRKPDLFYFEVGLV
jgi:hypothetical protein